MITRFMSLLSIATTVRNNVWRDSYALYSDSAKKSPDKPRTHLNLGVALRRSGDISDAIGAFRAALSIDPQNQRARDALNALLSTRSNDAEPATVTPDASVSSATPSGPCCRMASRTSLSEVS